MNWGDQGFDLKFSFPSSKNELGRSRVQSSVLFPIYKIMNWGDQGFNLKFSFPSTNNELGRSRVQS